MQTSEFHALFEGIPAGHDERTEWETTFQAFDIEDAADLAREIFARKSGLPDDDLDQIRITVRPHGEEE